MLLPKPEKRARVKARRRRQKDAARRECRATVWARDGARCVRCRRPVLPIAKLDGWDGQYAEGWEPYAGHVNETITRSRGGDPTNPDHCELLCQGCHYSGPSGAHAPTARRAA